MAIKPINDLISANYSISASLQSTPANAVHAGSCVTIDTTVPTNPLLRLANRANTGPVDTFIGFSADDASRTGNMFIQADPVGGNWITVDGSGNYTGFVAGNNGWIQSVKRAILDFQDETVTQVTNLTAGANGYQGPGRGVGVYTTPSGQFIVEPSVYAAVQTSSSTADNTAAYSFVPNDLLTFGAGVNAGKLVQLSNTSHGPAVARVDWYNSTTGLLQVTQLAV